jgi:type I restriction enzyme S subunit
MEKAGGLGMVNSNLAYKTGILQPEIVVKESPIKWCSVSLLDVVSRGKRLEASVFDVEAKRAWDIVLGNKYGSVPLYGKDRLIELAYYPG